LPEGSSWDSSPSATGDDCHYDIRGVTDKWTRSTFRTLPLEAFRICQSDESEQDRELNGDALQRVLGSSAITDPPSSDEPIR
jgi:hypothetical protein